MHGDGPLAKDKDGAAKDDALHAEFVHPGRRRYSVFSKKKNKNKNKSKKEKELPLAPPVAYHVLFRYATCAELALTALGVLAAVASAVLMPAFIVLYGEFTTLLVEREANETLSSTLLLSVFGGGKPPADDSPQALQDARIADAAAFGLGSTAFSLGQLLLDVVAVTLLNAAALRQIARVRARFLRAVLRQDMAWFDTSGAAGFASRLTDDLDKLQEGIGEKLAIFTYQMVSFFMSVLIAFIYGWKLTLVVFSCAPVIIIATALVSKVQSSLAAQELRSYGAAGAVVEEVLSAVRTVVAFGGQKSEVDRYSDKLEPSQRMGIRRGLFSGLGAAIMWFITYCSYALAFWYGVELILDSRESGSMEYTPGILVIILFGMLGGALNMGMALPLIEAFNVARGAAATVFDIIERTPSIDALSDKGERPTELLGDIELRGVSFRYPARPEVQILQGLDLHVQRGETVALVGASGCGKSTVLQLLQRLYDPEAGSVILDGRNVKDLNLGWLRRQIGVVGQEPVLFATTISENIRYGREDASRDDIEAAAKEAGAHEFISRLPQGYETVLGDQGTQLSGGQKQRIAIARALVRDPHILLLDEATSALDLASEARVQAALERAAQGRTTLVVAHRLSTVAGADRIVCLAGGKVVEQGTHAQLMEARGHYYGLVTASSEADPDEISQAAEDSGDDEDLDLGDAGDMSSPLSRQQSITSARSSRSIRASMRSQLKESTPTQVLEDEDTSYPAPLTRILKLNRKEWGYIFVGCIASALVGSSFPMFAILFGEVFNVLALPDPDDIRSKTQIFNILFLGIGVLAGLGSFLQSYTFGVAGVRLTTRLRKDVFQAMLEQEMAWYDNEKNRVGALCARLSGDAASVQGATGSRLGSILQAVSTLFVGAIIALVYSWKMALVALASVPIVFGSVFLEARVIHTEGLDEKLAVESATKIAVETIANIRTVAGLGGEEAFLHRYELALFVSGTAARKKMRLRGIVWAIGQTAPFFGYAAAFYYGGYLVAVEGLPFKGIIMVGEALIFGSWMLGQSMAFAPNFGTAKLAAGRLFSLLDRKPLIHTLPSAQPISKTEGAAGIFYDKVNFFYPTRPGVPVLRGLQLEMKAGTTVALVGPSGCGKSTVIQLLQRLYDPVTGTVALDGRDTSSLPLDGLRAQLGIVSQEPVLFDRTIAENIAYGDNSRKIPVDEIIAAAKKSNIHNFISALPLGYETRLGAKGTQLSGGQKQRIAIARALVRNPRVLLLDEATSALDNQSEKVVQEALDQARDGRTCITIAHRLATVQQADVICVLERGVVAEMGSHQQLLARRGLYYQMHQKSLASST